MQRPSWLMVLTMSPFTHGFNKKGSSKHLQEAVNSELSGVWGDDWLETLSSESVGDCRVENGGKRPCDCWTHTHTHTRMYERAHTHKQTQIKDGFEAGLN